MMKLYKKKIIRVVCCHPERQVFAFTLTTSTSASRRSLNGEIKRGLLCRTDLMNHPITLIPVVAH